MDDDDDEFVWMDEDGGRLVRPYSVIRGRTSPSHRDLDLFQMVSTRDGLVSPQVPDAEYGRILELCRNPLSIAEVAAYSGLPMAVAKVIISDLLDNGYLVAGSSMPERDPRLLMLILEGLKRL
ncbi:DUF742 domain-containing protein [Kineosporia sp. J2-2]|uniref:DUF742 domain-containing protein n=1 Tax=Kineosporia corallincola TaxID=2835133 RepID=A0ABS5THT8_9ACTN|nr:DUF742 domain-containing protein [Kineosporia corallincola]MBT0770659.1 DUF742 domain-containing protein [Kineosporia corallincola]